MSKNCLITGITGQAGSLLSRYLLEKDYKIYGLERRSSVKNRQNLKDIESDIEFIEGDLLDGGSLFRALKISTPEEVYNLAAQSFVAESFKTPINTADITGLGVLRLLEAIRDYDKPLKLLQMSSSEMFGKCVEIPSNESTPFYPRSPYGISKLLGYWMAKNYRESYNMFVSNAICFNFESEYRGHEFVTRKISDGVAKIKLGLADHITLGNLDAIRDWSYGVDTIDGLWKILQHEEPDDFVLGTGVTHSIRDFLEIAFNYIGIEDWSNYVKTDPMYFRPAEVDVLQADYSKARDVLGWMPTTPFYKMVTIMIDNDLKILGSK